MICTVMVLIERLLVTVKMSKHVAVWIYREAVVIYTVMVLILCLLFIAKSNNRCGDRGGTVFNFLCLSFSRIYVARCTVQRRYSL